MQSSRAVVLVLKDLTHHKDFFCIALEPSSHSGLLGSIQLIYAQKTLFSLVLFVQGVQTEVKLQGVTDAGLRHLAHHLVLCFLIFALALLRCKAAVLNRVFQFNPTMAPSPLKSPARAAPWPGV